MFKSLKAFKELKKFTSDGAKDKGEGCRDGAELRVAVELENKDEEIS